MPGAIRSVFAASVALAGAGAIAVSPLAPLPERATVQTPAITLAAASSPALGAIPLQILINQLGDAVALAPILIGSTEQCAVCLGPTSADPVPFTGYGAIGILAGIVSAPVVLINTLVSTGDVWKARGTAGLAIQTPITNTFLQLIAPRPLGGFNLEGTLTREFAALNDAITGILAIAAQALVTGPVTVIGGAVSAGQLFTQTLASTGDFIQAATLGGEVLRAAVDSAGNDLVTAITTTRNQVYNDLTSNAPAAAARTSAKAARSSAAIKPASKPARASGTAKRSGR